MEKRLLIMLLFFYSLNSFVSYSAIATKEDIPGIYYGKIRAGGSISGQDIALRFYPDGDVLAVIIPRRPAYMDNFARSFARENKGRYSKGKYTIENGVVNFELDMTVEKSKFRYKFKGKISFTKSVKVMLFTIYNTTNNMGYRLYAEQVWTPGEGAIGDKRKPEIVIEEKDDAPSIIENKKKINDEIKSLDQNLKQNDINAATKNLNNIGLSHFNNKYYEDAIENFEEALILGEMEGNQKAVADIRNNLGVSHERLNQKKAALENFRQAVKDYKALGDEASAAKVLFQISLLEKNHLDKEAEQKALEELAVMEQNMKNTIELSATYNSLAINLMKQSKPEEANQLLEKAFGIDQQNNLRAFEAISINNKGNIQLEQGNIRDAINSYKQSLVIKEEISDKGSQAITFHNLGNALYSLGELKKAEEYLRRSLLLAKEAKVAKTMNANYRALANLLADANSCMDPLDNYKNYISMRFAVIEAEVIKPLYEEKAKYLNGHVEGSLAEDIEKLGIGNDDLISINMLQEDLRQAQIVAEQEIRDAKNQVLIQNNDKALLASQNEAEEAKTKTLTFMVMGAAVSGILVLALLGFAIRSKNRTKKDKLKIEEQKNIIEAKNKNFMDSVTYASRLQTAILPPENVLSQQLKEFFVLYKPKDIVAGDFYWTETVGDYTYVAAADCTGHGVPGAMVSVVCSNSLFRAVNEFGLRDTGAILDKTRDLVIQTFEKSVEEVKDGMDIAMIRIEKGSKKIQYTGAHNSLLISRLKNGQEISDKFVQDGDKYLEEYKADKQPVGQYSYAKSFKTNTIDIKEGDQFFLFSDGYADQFGGDKGKKMKLRIVKELFLEVSSLPLDQQRFKLEQSFMRWKGEYEQVDDVCVIGLKV